MCRPCVHPRIYVASFYPILDGYNLTIPIRRLACMVQCGRLVGELVVSAIYLPRLEPVRYINLRC